MRVIPTSAQGQSQELSEVLLFGALKRITREEALQTTKGVEGINPASAELPEFSISTSTSGLRNRRGDEAILTGIRIAQTIYRLKNEDTPKDPPKEPGKGPPEHDPEQLRRELAEDKEDRDSLYRR